MAVFERVRRLIARLLRLAEELEGLGLRFLEMAHALEQSLVSELLQERLKLASLGDAHRESRGRHVPVLKHEAHCRPVLAMERAAPPERVVVASRAGADSERLVLEGGRALERSASKS